MLLNDIQKRLKLHRWTYSLVAIPLEKRSRVDDRSSQHRQSVLLTGKVWFQVSDPQNKYNKAVSTLGRDDRE